MSFSLSRKSQDRLAALFPLVAVAFFAALSYWLEARIAASARPAKATPSAPEHFMEGFRIERTVAFKRGTAATVPIQDVISGERADYYPAALRTTIRLPRFQSEVPNKPRLTVAASQAIIHSEQPRGEVERIEFLGGVRLDQDATARREAIRFETEAITVFPATQEAVTDRETRTLSGDRVMITQGLHLDRELRTGSTRGGFRLELDPKVKP
jgi:Protein of unknown function (DUF1239).